MGANTSRVNTHVPTQQQPTLASPRPLDAWADLDYKLSGSSFVRTKERIQCAYEEQTALLFFLIHCDVSLLSLRTTGRCETMPHADVVADVIQTTDDSTKPCVGVSLQSANSQKTCLVATEEQSQTPQDSHGQHANGGQQKMPSQDSGWDADEQGCLWLHSRLAKKALAKFVTVSGRTGAAAQ
ncbi:hypothetical protein WJX82_002593 [Trebouxia sp. C0006]